MMMKGTNGSEGYDYCDRHFREACKTILGAEIGALHDYEDWLLSLKQPRGEAKSSISGKEIALVCPDYAKGARFVSFDESASLKPAPFQINDIKDIDSLFRAAGEQMAYSGNLVFGNSQFITSSTDISDSFYVYKSARVSGSKSVACSTIVKDSSYLFGCNVASKDEFCMRCHQFTFNTRCFEANITTSSSDCYYTYDCLGCKDIMFSFGQRNLNHAIGNLSLPKEKYLSLKQALLGQIRDELASKKKVASFSDIFSQAAKEKAEINPQMRSAGRKYSEAANPSAIQKAWDETCNVVLGKPIGKMSAYKDWLLRHQIQIRKMQSALGSGEIPCASYENLKALPSGRYINIIESHALSGELKLTEKEAESLSLGSAGKTLSRIAYITPQFQEGTNMNVANCPIVLWAADCDSVHGCVFCKKSAYSTWPRDSDHVFGCAFAFDSSFNINCYSSFKLQRCFEVDSSRGCTGCYFSHNIENVHDSMFCSNAKNLRYAVFNVEVGREKFMELKSRLMSKICNELEANGRLEPDIYNIAEAKSAK